MFSTPFAVSTLINKTKTLIAPYSKISLLAELLMVFYEKCYPTRKYFCL